MHLRISDSQLELFLHSQLIYRVASIYQQARSRWQKGVEPWR